jgi:tripartite motif-containing protein 71
MNTKLVFLLTKLLSSTNIAILVFLISMMQPQHGFSSVEEETEKNNDNSNNLPGFKSIKKFDSNGKFITSWGSEGTGNGQFLRPEDVTVDSSSGTIFVADFEGNNIQKFTSDGNFITKWGSEGYGDGQFWLPHDIAIDSSDNVYVVDSGNVHEKKDICAI